MIATTSRRQLLIIYQYNLSEEIVHVSELNWVIDGKAFTSGQGAGNQRKPHTLSLGFSFIFLLVNDWKHLLIINQGDTIGKYLCL